MNLTAKGLAIIALPVAVQIACFGVLSVQTMQAQRKSEEAAYDRQVSDAYSTVFRDVMQIWLIADRQKDPSLYILSPELHNTYADATTTLARLKELLKGTPDEATALKLDRQLRTLEVLGRKAVNEVEENGGHLGQRIFELRANLRVALEEILGTSNEIVERSEKERERSRALLAEEKIARQQANQTLAFFFIAELALTACIAIWLNVDVNKRLKVILENSYRLAAEKPLLPEISGRDELSHLDRVFHRMADALNQAVASERAMRENARDVICTFDARGKILAVNSACETVFAFSPDDLIGSNLNDLIVPSTGDPLLTRLNAKDEQEIEVQVMRKDKGTIDVLLSVRWSEKEQRFFCVAHNITERKQADRLKQEVLQMVSHDLRTPLSTISGFLELLGSGILGQLTEKGQRLLSHASSSAEFTLTLIKDFLVLERLEAGMLSLNCTTFPASPLLEDVQANASALAEAGGVHIDVVQTSLSMFADRDRITQVLLNLVGNAIKFSAPGSHVTLGARQLEGFVELSVSDQGRGISPLDLHCIFDRFKQTKTAEHGGFGLGLAICKSLVELHGGAISATSEIGKGSTFTLTVPDQDNRADRPV